MAYSFVDLVGTNGQANFSFSFPYISQDHITVFADGINQDFSFLSEFVVTLDTPLVGDATVRIKRTTPIDEPLVDYANGSVLGESDLDATALQSLFAAQEVADTADNLLQSDDAGNFDFEDMRGVNLAPPIDLHDAVNKQYADNQSGTAAQQAAVEQAEAAAAEAALTLVEILDIELTNVSEFMKNVLDDETAALARATLGALGAASPAIENPVITGAVTGAYSLETPVLTGDVTGVFNLVEPTVTDPVIAGDLTGTYVLAGSPTSDVLPGLVKVGTPLVQNPYAISSVASGAHGLGAIPTFVVAYLECLNTEGEYSVGDRVYWHADVDTGSAVNRGYSVGADATNIFLATMVTKPTLVTKTTHVAFTITAADWKLVVTSFRIVGA